MIIHQGTLRKLSSNAFQDPVARLNPTKQSAYSDNPREQQMRFIASDCIRKDSFITTATASSRSQALVHTSAVFRAKQLLPNQFKTSPTSLERWRTHHGFPSPQYLLPCRLQKSVRYFEILFQATFIRQPFQSIFQISMTTVDYFEKIRGGLSRHRNTGNNT